MSVNIQQSPPLASCEWSWSVTLQAQVLCQRMGSLRTLHNIGMVPRTAVLCTDISKVIPGISWSYCPSLGRQSYPWALQSPWAPPLPLPPTSSLVPLLVLDISGFSCTFFLMLLSLWVAKSINIAFLFCLSTTTMSCWLTIMYHQCGSRRPTGLQLQLTHDLQSQVSCAFLCYIGLLLGSGTQSQSLEWLWNLPFIKCEGDIDKELQIVPNWCEVTWWVFWMLFYQFSSRLLELLKWW